MFYPGIDKGKSLCIIVVCHMEILYDCRVPSLYSREFPRRQYQIKTRKTSKAQCSEELMESLFKTVWAPFKVCVHRLFPYQCIPAPLSNVNWSRVIPMTLHGPRQVVARWWGLWHYHVCKRDVAVRSEHGAYCRFEIRGSGMCVCVCVLEGRGRREEDTNVCEGGYMWTDHQSEDLHPPH